MDVWEDAGLNEVLHIAPIFKSLLSKCSFRIRTAESLLQTINSVYSSTQTYYALLFARRRRYAPLQVPRNFQILIFMPITECEKYGYGGARITND